MQEVNIYIETDIPPMKCRRGNVIYVLETMTSKGPATVSSMIPMENATQNRITLEALEEALERMSRLCHITIWTDCNYVANALRNRWLDQWKQNGWKNSKGEEICDVASWQEIARLAALHTVTVMPNKGSSYQDWMKTELRRANKDVFYSGVKKPFHSE